ncbi:hypothetical protein [Larkinella sp.]|uniref:hypothetical protein n=1 Tax=Larkinella sp. TaxID=2034517 RepID=UPI003BAD0CC7
MKTVIKHALVVLALFASTLVAKAQFKVGDNPTSINPGSVIEMESTNKGLLMPRISLTNTTTWGLAGTPAAGMHVYNTNASITSTNTAYPTLVAKVGEYYWDGTGWVALAPLGIQDSPVLFSVSNTANQTVAASATDKAIFGVKNYDKNNSFNLATNSFTVPANGTGVYQFSTIYSSTNLSYLQGVYVPIYVNGILTRYLSVANCSIGSGIAGAGTIIMPLNAGDVVDMRFNASLQPGQTSTFFFFNFTGAFISK